MKIDEGPLAGLIGSEESGWAMGCDHCRFGLIDPPPVATSSAPLYVARAIQHHHGYLAVCDCRAGVTYGQLLVRTWNRISDKSEHIPLSWSTAIHTQLRALDEAPPIHAVHGMEVD